MSDREMLLGRYELRGVLGRGGMAEVRDGWDTRLHRAVAVKLLHPALAADPDTRRRFEDEARSAAALNHPNIVSVHDCGVDGDRFFIVMERLPGHTLHDLIARGPLPPPRVRAVLDDVLAAVAVAHGAGVLHRDIKPANVLVSADGTAVKVADFGIAKAAGAAHTMTGQIVGTMAYMSPERIAGAPASVADDLYAVGIIGFEAATGQRAHPQDNPAVLARAILDGPAPSLAAARPDIDPALTVAVDRAVAKDPRRRFTDVAQMRAALTAGTPRPATKVLDAPVPLPADPDYFVPARKRRGLSRNQMFLAAAAAFLAALIALVALSVDSTPATGRTGPADTSTVAPPPPSPSPTPVVSPAAPQPERPTGPKGEKKGPGPGSEKPGNGNPGNGNNKRD